MCERCLHSSDLALTQIGHTPSRRGSSDGLLSWASCLTPSPPHVAHAASRLGYSVPLLHSSFVRALHLYALASQADGVDSVHHALPLPRILSFIVCP
jgi:hypothetical protein